MEHAGGDVDVLAYVVLIRLAAGELDEAAEEDEAVVGILHAAAGGEADGSIAVKLDVIGECANVEAVGGVLGGEDVACSAGMAEQLAYGHASGEVVIGVVGPVRSDGFVEERACPAGTSWRIASGGKHLIHGAEAELGVDAVGNLLRGVGEPPCLFEDDIVFVREEAGTGKGVVSVERGDALADFSGDVVIVCGGWIGSRGRGNGMAHHASRHFWRVGGDEVER